MTKCDFCADAIDAGLPPSCVAACPMRALDYGERAELEMRYGTAVIFPLPEALLTEPALVVTPHKNALRMSDKPAVIANREEA